MPLPEHQTGTPEALMQPCRGRTRADTRAAEVKSGARGGPHRLVNRPGSRHATQFHGLMVRRWTERD